MTLGHCSNFIVGRLLTRVLAVPLKIKLEGEIQFRLDYYYLLCETLKMRITAGGRHVVTHVKAGDSRLQQADPGRQCDLTISKVLGPTWVPGAPTLRFPCTHTLALPCVRVRLALK